MSAPNEIDKPGEDNSGKEARDQLIDRFQKNVKLLQVNHYSDKDIYDRLKMGKSNFNSYYHYQDLGNGKKKGKRPGLPFLKKFDENWGKEIRELTPVPYEHTSIPSPFSKAPRKGFKKNPDSNAGVGKFEHQETLLQQLINRLKIAEDELKNLKTGIAVLVKSFELIQINQNADSTYIRQSFEAFGKKLKAFEKRLPPEKKKKPSATRRKPQPSPPAG